MPDFSKKLSFVLAFYNSFTGRQIYNRDISVTSRDVKIFRKDDGFYIAINAENEVCHISVSGGYYIPKEFDLNIKDIKNPCDIINVLLLPKKNFFTGKNISALTGRCSEKEISVLCPYGSKLRLSADYKAQDNQISLYNPNAIDMRAGDFMIFSKETGAFRRLKILSMEKKPFCKLAEPLDTDFKMYDTVFYRLYSNISETKDEYFIPFEKLSDSAGIIFADNQIIKEFDCSVTGIISADIL